MKMPEVKCSVANCHYHGEGNMCTADAIMVDVERHANAQFDMEIGEVQVDLKHKDHAKNKQETLCHTFEKLD